MVCGRRAGGPFLTQNTPRSMRAGHFSGFAPVLAPYQTFIATKPPAVGFLLFALARADANQGSPDGRIWYPAPDVLRVKASLVAGRQGHAL